MGSREAASITDWTVDRHEPSAEPRRARRLFSSGTTCTSAAASSPEQPPPITQPLIPCVVPGTESKSAALPESSRVMDKNVAIGREERGLAMSCLSDDQPFRGIDGMTAGWRQAADPILVKADEDAGVEVDRQGPHRRHCAHRTGCQASSHERFAQSSGLPLTVPG